MRPRKVKPTDRLSSLQQLILMKLFTWPCPLCDSKTPGQYVPWKPRVILGEGYRRDAVSRSLKHLERRGLVRRGRTRTAPRQPKTFSVALTQAGHDYAHGLVLLAQEHARYAAAQSLESAA